MFRGIAQINLDIKGRLAVPARHRELLQECCQGHLVITADADRCLLVYPLPDWEGIQQKLEALSNLDPRVRQLQRRLIGFAVDTEMDAAGRILLSPALRQYAALEKAVVMVGQGKKFELWDQGLWDKQMATSGELVSGELPTELEGFSL
ncbi:MAG: division/cell wall cluster transcriptional repressor MraZ [Betaproteobacteria bacterium]|jgi:MraZ protein